MSKNNQNTPPVMNIKDLALLKQHPHHYWDEIFINLEKTHDGTSSTPIKSQLQDFYKESRNSMYRHTRVVSPEGKEVTHIQTVADDKGNEYYDMEYDMLFEDWENADYNSATGLHLLTKPTGEDNNSNAVFYDKNGDSYLLPSLDDLSLLSELNDEGNYFFRSQTLVSKDGTSTTIIKNNKFTAEDELKLMEMMGDVERDIKNHNQSLKDRARDISENHMRQWDLENPRRDNETSEDYKEHNKRRWAEIDKSREQAQKQALEELGDTKTYVNENWSNRIEEECNVKLKMQKHNMKKYDDGTVYDEIDYGNDWAEEHNIIDYSIGGGAFASEGDFWAWKEGH